MGSTKEQITANDDHICILTFRGVVTAIATYPSLALTEIQSDRPRVRAIIRYQDWTEALVAHVFLPMVIFRHMRMQHVRSHRRRKVAQRRKVGVSR
jgi:hypothetical protein